MKIVVDANVVVAALVRSSITREVLLYPYIDYYSPDFLLDEIKEHEKEISAKSGKGYKPALELILKKIRVMPSSFYEKDMREAHTVIGDIDKDDEPYVALALSLRAEGIWSYDADFKRQRKVKIFSICDLSSLMKKGIA
jgi:predicted nucleic acid-binding protein